MLLRITDGTTTLTLSGSGTYVGATYFPASQSNADRIGESLPVILEGTDSAIRTAPSRTFSAACGRQRIGTRRDRRYFVEFRPRTAATFSVLSFFGGDANYSQAPGQRQFSTTPPARCGSA